MLKELSFSETMMEMQGLPKTKELKFDFDWQLQLYKIPKVVKPIAKLIIYFS